MVVLLNEDVPVTLEIGRKARNLSLLLSSHFNVPDGLVLPLDFFVCTESELQNKLAELSGNLMQVLPSAEGWAIRSSATDEDGISGAKAGKYKTLVINNTDELSAAVAGVHEGSIPVIIQRFVEPEYAGVLFTCDPLTGAAGLHIELVKGRGEQLVGGDVNPLFSYKNGSWDKPSGFLEQLILQLSPWADTAIELLRCHVDMEFCIKDGVIYWLQVRPVTTGIESTNAPKGDAYRYEDSIALDENWFLLDQCTEPITPLVRHLDPGGFFQMPYWDTCFVRHYPYVRMKQASNPGISIEPITDWPTLKTKFENEFDSQLQQDLGNIDMVQLWEMVKQRVEVNRAYVARYLDRGWLKERRMTGEKLRGLIRRYAGEDADAEWILISLTEGLNTLTYQKATGLHRLIASARQVPCFEELTASILAGELSHPWTAQFNAFIHKYGYELPHPLALHMNTLAESTEGLLTRICAELGKNPDREKSYRQGDWKAAASAIEQLMDNGARPEFRELLERYRAFLIRTEDDDYLLQKGASAIRRVLLEIARRFVSEGIIKDSGSIFFLYPDEIADIIRGSAPAAITAVIARRQADFEADQKVVPVLHPAAHKVPAGDLEKHLQCVGVSRGVAEGKVHKILNPLDRACYSAIPEDAIIVASVLTPNLTYSIISCAAIVTEVGGFLSHGAIFAREMGIPAVVQAAGVTDWLNTGDEIIVDADKGLITKLK